MHIKLITYALAISSILSFGILNTAEETSDFFGNTELHYAMRRCITSMPQLRYTHIDEICKLLHNGLLTSTKNEYDMTPLKFATYHSSWHDIPLQDDEYDLCINGTKSKLYKQWLKRNPELKKLKKNTLPTVAKQDSQAATTPNRTHKRSISLDIPADASLALAPLHMQPPLTPPAITVSYISS